MCWVSFFQSLIEKLHDDMKRAGEAEKDLTVARDDEDSNGVPLITVCMEVMDTAIRQNLAVRLLLGRRLGGSCPSMSETNTAASVR